MAALNDQAKEQRALYMAGKLTHDEYYLWLADQIHVGEKSLPVSIERLRASTDPHFNDIQLVLWDRRDPVVRHQAAAYGMRAWSLSDTVCVLKAVARRAVAQQSA